MSSVTLRAVGGSVVMALPKRLLELAHLQAGSKVNIDMEQGRLVIAPQKKPSYRLADLIAKCDAQLPISSEERKWMDMPAVGLEKEGWGN